MKQITITRVVSRNFIIDFLGQIQNTFGMNLTGYEKMLNKAVTQITDEIKEKNIKLKWFRYETTQLTNGAVAVLLYGELK